MELANRLKNKVKAQGERNKKGAHVFVNSIPLTEKAVVSLLEYQF